MPAPQPTPNISPRAIRPNPETKKPAPTSGAASLGIEISKYKKGDGVIILSFISSNGGSPAQAANLQKGDVVLSIGSCKTATVQDYIGCMLTRKPQETVSLRFVRSGGVMVRDVVLGERLGPSQPGTWA